MPNLPTIGSARARQTGIFTQFSVSSNLVNSWTADCPVAENHSMSEIPAERNIPATELLAQLYLATRPDAQGFHTSYIAAGNPTCAEEILNYFSHSGSSSLRCRVAEKPGTPVFVLTRLCLDPDPKVREAVADNFDPPQA